MIFPRKRVAWVVVLSAIAFCSESAPAAAPGVGDSVANFSLLDYAGKNYDLRRTDARAVVLFFTGSDCPIARQSGSKLQEIAEAYGPTGVTVWLVNATPQNDPDTRKLDVMYELGRYAPREILGDRYAINGLRDLVPQSVLGDRETIRKETLQYVFGVPPLPAVLRDEHQIVSRYFGVARTCETVVIDTEDSKVIYRGAVDDQFAEGARRPAATKHYLKDALNDFLAGRPVAEAKTKVHGCVVTYTAVPEGREATYTRDVAPVLAAKCASCHSDGQIGPFAMSDYDKVKGWSGMIREVVLDRRMPPWHADPHVGKFANERSLTLEEANLLVKWVGDGCPRGEGEDVLAASTAAVASAKVEKSGWELGAPDFVARIPGQEIPATGAVDYRYIDSDFVVPRDMWVRAAVTRPGSAKVVHHVIVRARMPARYDGPKSESFLFTTWVPGLEQGEFPPGTGVFLPKGATFNFEVHYTPDGQPRTDVTEIGLYEAKEKPKMQFEVRAAHTRELDIPPGQSEARHAATYFFRRDAMLYGLAPHMHVRGSSFKFELMTPDGKRESLLSVPSYDFNWQTGYVLAKPRRIPAGSWMLCTGAFDNSAKNPHNPDATKRVTWGPQTWNEMFMGFMDVADIVEEADSGG